MPSYVITGTSRGLGRELVRQLSTRPDTTVFALVRNPSAATALSELAAQRGPDRIQILKADVTDPASLVAAAEAVGAATGGTLDVLIHNAFEAEPAGGGLTPSQLPSEREALDKLFTKSWGTDVYGTVWVTNAFLPLVEKGVEKKVVHMSTGAADLDLIKATSLAAAVPYAIAKAGMNVLTTKYAAEFKEKGVKFLALSPGWVDTAEGPASPEMEAVSGMMLTIFRRAEPGLQGPLARDDSVRMLLEVISGLDEKLSGSFVSHHGNKEWF